MTNKTSMIMLTLVCIVPFPDYAPLNLMAWALVSIGSVPLPLMGTYFRPQKTGTKGRVLTSTPRKTSAQSEEEAAQQQQLQANRMYTTNQVPQQTQEPSSRSYDADTSTRDNQCIHNTQGRYIPPLQRHPNDHGPSSGSGNRSSQSSDREAVDDTTIYTGIPHQKTTDTDSQTGPSSNSKTQTCPSTWQPIRVTGAMQTSPAKSTQMGGTQTTPPPHPNKTTSSGGTQTSPPDLLTTTNMTRVHRVNQIAIRRQRLTLSPR